MPHTNLRSRWANRTRRRRPCRRRSSNCCDHLAQTNTRKGLEGYEHATHQPPKSMGESDPPSPPVSPSFVQLLRSPGTNKHTQRIRGLRACHTPTSEVDGRIGPAVAARVAVVRPTAAITWHKQTHAKD